MTLLLLLHVTIPPTKFITSNSKNHSIRQTYAIPATRQVFESLTEASYEAIRVCVLAVVAALVGRRLAALFNQFCEEIKVKDNNGGSYLQQLQLQNTSYVCRRYI